MAVFVMAERGILIFGIPYQNVIGESEYMKYFSSEKIEAELLQKIIKFEFGPPKPYYDPVVPCDEPELTIGAAFERLKARAGRVLAAGVIGSIERARNRVRGETIYHAFSYTLSQNLRILPSQLGFDPKKGRTKVDNYFAVVYTNETILAVLNQELVVQSFLRDNIAR